MKFGLSGVATVMGVFGWSGVVWAWSNAALVSVKVHEHKFDEVTVEGKDCQISAVLSYEAPKAGYLDNVAHRNAYNFKARLRFANGKTMSSPQFRSTSPGRQSVRLELDSTTAGCWGKEKQSVIKVDVEGCRGLTCVPKEPS